MGRLIKVCAAGTFLSAMMIATTGMGSEQDDDHAKARLAVRRSLPFLEESGSAWIRDRGCVTCHHTPFLIWTHAEADRRGIEVDRVKLDAWTNWTLLNVVSNLDAEPDGEGDTLSQLLLGRYTGSAWFDKPLLWHSRPADPYENVTKHLLKAQKEEGNWIAGGQSRNPNELPTGWAIHALASREAFMREKFRSREESATFQSMITANDKAIPPSIEKALTWLRQQDVEKTAHLTEGLVTRLLVERRFGSSIYADQLLTQLLARQNPDGGWSTNLEQKHPGDAFATGQALYALRLAGKHDHVELESISRAVDFLVKSQREDGSWMVPTKAFSPPNADETRLRETDRVYTYWGTGWATVGLLQTIPVSEQATLRTLK